VATDDRFEPMLAAAVRRYLDSVDGPHGVWADAPMARALGDLHAEHRSPRPWPRASLLFAAAIAVVLASAAVLVAGGQTRPALPPPTTAPLVAPRVSPSPSPAVVIVDPAATATPAPPTTTPGECLTSWSQAGSGSAPPTKQSQMNLEDLDDTNGRFGFGLYLILSEAVADLDHIMIEPTHPPFHNAAGHTVEVSGSSFLRLAIRGLEYDQSAVHLPSTQLGPGSGGVVPPITAIEQIQRSGIEHVWIIGLESPVCLTVRTSYDTVDGSKPASDNVVFIGLSPKSE
jgi:hypothetical protein